MDGDALQSRRSESWSRSGCRKLFAVSFAVVCSSFWVVGVLFFFVVVQASGGPTGWDLCPVLLLGVAGPQTDGAPSYASVDYGAPACYRYRAVLSVLIY